jgi:hypothetical protein
MFTPAVALLCAAPLEKIEAFLAELRFTACSWTAYGEQIL